MNSLGQTFLLFKLSLVVLGTSVLLFVFKDKKINGTKIEDLGTGRLSARSGMFLGPLLSGMGFGMVLMWFLRSRI